MGEAGIDVGLIGSDVKILDPEDFRKNAHQMVDFIADYYRSIEKFPVRSQVTPGYLKKLLPSEAPEDPESFQEILSGQTYREGDPMPLTHCLITDVQHKIIPGVTHWMSPSFFGYFPASSSTASMLGSMLSDAFNVVAFNWLASPAAAELEVITLDWLGKLLNLPNCFLSGGNGGGIIQGTASEAILLAMLAARSRALEKDDLTDLSKLAVYTSDQMHSCLEKACVVAGIPLTNIVVLPTEKSENYSLSPVVLKRALKLGVASGLVPFFLGATIGTTSSTANDPVSTLGDLALEYGMWFHVDAAYGGNACICPEYQYLLEGLDKADSFNLNLHKWLLTNFGCSALWLKDSSHLTKTLGSTNSEYLVTKVNSSAALDFKDWEIPLGRSFRSLKLWFVMRLYGGTTLRELVRKHIRLAKHFEDMVHEDPRFEVILPRTFAMVCFRLKPRANEGEEASTVRNSTLMEKINETGKVFLTHTMLSGVYMLRMAIGATLTELEHVDEAWQLIQNVADADVGTTTLRPHMQFAL